MCIDTSCDVAKLAEMLAQGRVLEPERGFNPFTRSIFQTRRSVDRGSSDCFQTINVLEQELMFPWCG